MELLCAKCTAGLHELASLSASNGTGVSQQRHKLPMDDGVDTAVT